MACFRLVTFLPERPDLSLPRFISCIARSTFLPALAPYFSDFFFCAMGGFLSHPPRSPADRPARIERRERIHDDQRGGQPEEHLGDAADFLDSLRIKADSPPKG